MSNKFQPCYSGVESPTTGTKGWRYDSLFGHFSHGLKGYFSDLHQFVPIEGTLLYSTISSYELKGDVPDQRYGDRRNRFQLWVRLSPSHLTFNVGPILRFKDRRARILVQHPTTTGGRSECTDALAFMGSS
ncbi:hypothetical protein RHGRI_027434 [Rhododendron griersonianum]|uniref:Uncharacterized protein n=1 Tax=Rhododendron griersonianum TaxID=479676 RepID=A0AAV6J1G9_9ERIC|nr:hypothetical protein RHGRI_027434 [Rhododendron griersonianum]